MPCGSVGRQERRRASASVGGRRRQAAAGHRQQTQGGDGLALSRHPHTLPGTCDVRCSAGVAATEEGCKPGEQAGPLDTPGLQCNRLPCCCAAPRCAGPCRPCQQGSPLPQIGWLGALPGHRISPAAVAALRSGHAGCSDGACRPTAPKAAHRRPLPPQRRGHDGQRRSDSH